MYIRYMYSAVVDLRIYTTFNDIQNYRDSVHYRDSRSHSLLPSPSSYALTIVLVHMYIRTIYSCF